MSSQGEPHRLATRAPFVLRGEQGEAGNRGGDLAELILVSGVVDF
jgi:hypothetical protein